MALQSVGSVPIDVNASAIDFLDAHVVFDSTGARYAVNGDGRLYKFDAAGELVDSLDLTSADGSVRSMETESGYFARDRAGRIYASYAGNVYVVASSGLAGKLPAVVAHSPRLLAGVQAKQTSLAEMPMPAPPED